MSLCMLSNFFPAFLDPLPLLTTAWRWLIVVIILGDFVYLSLFHGCDCAPSPLPGGSVDATKNLVACD